MGEEKQVSIIPILREYRRPLQFDEKDNIVCYQCKSINVVCMDRCTKHYCIDCTAHQSFGVAPYFAEDVMSPRSRWQYGMGIGNRKGEDAIRFMNDVYINSY